MQSVGNTFFIRTVQPNRPTTIAPEYSRHWLTLDPPCVEFNDYPSSKISICKLNLKNDSRFPRRVALVQPSKAYFEVKMKSRQLPPKDTTEVYVVFNPQREKGRIEDEFCIKVQGEGTVLHVPIICQYKSAGRAWSSKQIIYAKQNQEEKVSRGPPKRRMAVPRSRQVSIENRYSLYLDLKKISLIQFQQKFDRVFNFIEQKKVKNEVCRGQKPIDTQIRGEIMEYGQKIAQLSRRTVGKRAVSRWSVEYRQEGPVVQLFSGVNLGWDPSRNSSELVLRNGVGKMQEQVRKFIISVRFDKIKQCFNLFKDFRAREQQAGKALRLDDYLQQLKRLDNNRTGNELQFQFDKGSLRHEQLPVDYQRGAVQVNFLQRNAQFDIMQRIGFDNWVTVNWLREDHVQNYQTTAHPIPPFWLHMPAYTRGNRRGALSEMPLWVGNGCEVELTEGWESGQWPEKIAWQMMSRQERYYYPQIDDKVEIGDEKLCLGDDPEKWLQEYIKDL